MWTRARPKDSSRSIDVFRTNRTKTAMILSSHEVLKIPTCNATIGKYNHLSDDFVAKFSGKDVAKQTFQLHYNYCVKNIQKCPYCEMPVAKAEMMDHLAQMKGSSEQAKAAAIEGDFESL